MWELEKHYPKIFQVIHSVLVNLWSKTLGNNFNTLGRLLTKVNYCFEVRFKWFHLGFEITLNPVMYKVMTAKPQCCPKCSGVEHTTQHYFPLGTQIQCPFYHCFHVFSMQLRTSWLFPCVLPSNATLPTSLRATLLSAAMKPALFPGTSCSQSPQADSPMSYLSLGVVCRYPSESITLFHTRYKVCQSQTLFQWENFVLAQTRQKASTTETVPFHWNWSDVLFLDKADSLIDWSSQFIY